MDIHRLMRKIIGFVMMMGCVGASTAASLEQYANSVEKVSTTYAQEMRGFLRGLDPQLSQFNSEQKNKFCSIVNQYVQDMSQAIDQNRSVLTEPYASMTKQDVIHQVADSKEMQLLKKYNIQCDFT